LAENPELIDAPSRPPASTTTEQKRRNAIQPVSCRDTNPSSSS
jgi:hypothetical protein